MSSAGVAVVDYGVGNLRSLQRGLRRAGAEVVVSAEPDVIARAGRLVLPGVGSFGHAMQALTQRGLTAVLTRKVLEQRTPVLGICLGLELLTGGSEESQGTGLGWIAGTTRRLEPARKGASLPIPQLGWNAVEPVGSSSLFRGLEPGVCFYFAHSYAVECDDQSDVAATTEYGRRLVAAVQRGHIFGTQFHPEKSHANGIALLERFLDYS